MRECGSDGKPTHRDAALPNTEPRSLDCRAVPPRKPADRPTILDSHPHSPPRSHPSHTYTLPYPGVSHPPASPTPQRQRGSPSSLWTAMFAHRLRFNSLPLNLSPFPTNFLPRTQPQYPLSSPLRRFFSRNLQLSLFVLFLSCCFLNFHPRHEQSPNLPITVYPPFLAQIYSPPRYPYNPIRIYIFFASECPGCSHSLHASVHCFFQQSEITESFFTSSVSFGRQFVNSSLRCSG